MATWIALLAVLMMLPAAEARAAEPSGPLVRYTENRLTVHAHGAPLAEIVSEIGRQSGAAIVGEVRKPRDVSQDFESVPLVDGLARLLGEQNFTLRYGPGGHLRTIGLLGEALAPAASTTPVVGAGETPATSSSGPGGGGGRGSARRTPADAGGQVTVRAADGRVRKAGRVRRRRPESNENAPEIPALLGAIGQQPPAQQSSQQSSAAAQAQSSADNQPLTADDLERKLRRSFLNTLGQMDDASLAAYLATPEGQRAAALLQYYAAHHQTSSANQKANGILGRMPN